jgi:hypothetical protein
MKANKKILFIPIFFICVLTINYFCYTYYSKKEFKQKINFSIAKINITSALRCELYDKNGTELDLNSYTFFKTDSLRTNDSIVKKENSSKMLVYRKNNSGKYIIFSEFQPD